MYRTNFPKRLPILFPAIVVVVLLFAYVCIDRFLSTSVRQSFEDDPPIEDRNVDGGIALFVISGGHLINDLQACAVVSAAKHHPDRSVVVYKQDWMRSHRLWHDRSNVIVEDLDLQRLLSDTPLFDWYLDGNWTRSSLWEYHMSDALRLAWLYKHGGTYLDTDVIVLRSFRDLPSDVLGYEDDQQLTINGAVMMFEKRHPFLQLAMQKFVEQFDDHWAHQGPALLTRVMTYYNSSGMMEDWPVRVLPKDYFYPVSWQNLEISRLFAADGRIPESLRDSYAVHLWNKATRKLRVGHQSPLWTILKHHCLE